ncbi:hypothetical protein [Cupriavidus taiwanensis]|uniref:Uncharacterized protein n=1 Tax=Cupriavidus taiwanensis TaxID=164546 RepID=A0A7Z7JGG7_9BURK|nr:hypothetical protein [Cupriavidus taiwanensis]SOZ19444.1 hypothetical protein CBM2597_U50006 [Cupriavidus taiwanensis]SOZ97251.1 hypothetical protein CBM2598_U50007 [Cupriavidus taiwanensis]SPC26140.1 hypothetical protein CBM2594_U60006 [Cupriavidus taiwanensis]SPD37725.1 protein of unknown function [Cupriavidus taiwanensis]
MAAAAEVASGAAQAEVNTLRTALAAEREGIAKQEAELVAALKAATEELARMG